MSNKITPDVKPMIVGINEAANLVRTTFGAAGRTVCIQRSYGAPSMTKDGASVLRAIDLAEPCENAGLKVLVQYAEKVEALGDGTTGFTIMAQEILRESQRLIDAGSNTTQVREGMEAAVQICKATIQKNTRLITINDETLKNVATIAANNDSFLGEKIAEAIAKVGPSGIVTAEDSRSRETEVKVTEGMQFDRGYISHFFVTNPEEQTAELEEAHILVYEDKISNLETLVPLLEAVARTGKPLFIIAEDVEGQALTALILNKMRGSLKVAAVKAPGFGDRRKAMMEDIAILTKATFVSKDLGITLENVKMTDLGYAHKVKIDKDNTLIVGGKAGKTDIDARCAMIQKQIDSSTSDYDTEKLRERLAKLQGGVAVIRVGGDSEIEIKERKDRVEDAIGAATTALKHGVVTGGGTIYLDCRRDLEKKISESVAAGASEDHIIGMKVVCNALKAPLTQLAHNAHLEAAVIMHGIEKKRFAENHPTAGFDFRKRQAVDCMFKEGIVDAAAIPTSILEFSTSLAATLNNSSGMISEIKEEAKGAGAEGAGGMGMSPYM